MIVYHGSTVEIAKPDLKYSKNNLDFGKGFYVTTFKEQAEKWALRKSVRENKGAIVNMYEVSNFEKYRVKRFTEANADWLNFVCDCRNGKNVYCNYDVVVGNVADDEVIKCVRMYMRGVWDEVRTIEEMKYYKQNDQIAFLSQLIIDETVSFKGSYGVKNDG